MKTVLFPYDDSAPAQRALQYLVDFSKRCEGLTVHVLNVQSDPKLYGRYGALMDVLKQLKENATAHSKTFTDKAVATLEAAGVKAVGHPAIGEVLEEVQRVIKENDCDTVVMGTRGMGGLGNLLLGSMATQVIHGVSIPVLLVK
ncbi:universal stress protein [Paracandidimonas soli]|uniref:Nucleotide-binding universal stress UspA family protein n=1 Tax=Paracandidimonas soli TaxID=1917182 RepID=A0A4R3URH2_9BURK|nr:universal stress protein [Paracandidimonas soli]TCU93662.1 nucleotide-binding universal stress UspA family protein [Paracandidimonas soli]